MTYKCIVKDCENHSNEGGFKGDVCLPCYEFITTGKGKYSQMYRNTHPVKQLENGYFLPIKVLNEPMKKDIEALIDHAKKGRWSNAIVRQDGVETTYEADWIKLLKPVTHPVKQLSDEEIQELAMQYLENTEAGIVGVYDFVRAIIKEITE